MHTAQDIFPVTDLAAHQRQMMLARNVVDKAIDTKISVTGRQFCRCLLYHMVFIAPQIILQVFDGDKAQSVFFGKLPQLGRAHHRTVIPHDLTAKSAFRQSCQTAKVNGRFRVSVPHQNAAFSCRQRKHVSGSSEILRLCSRIRTRAAGISSFLCGNARGGIHMVDRHRKRRAVVVGVFRYHLRKLQTPCNLLRHRRTDQSPSVFCHKIDVFSCGKFRRTDQVAFVFPVGIVRTENNLTAFQRLKRLRYGLILIFHPASSSFRKYFWLSLYR